MANKEKDMALPQDSEIICDVEGCRHKFTPNDIQVEYEQIKDGNSLGLKRSYFRCPKCGYKYTIDVTDTALRLKIKEYKNLIKKQKRLMTKGCGEQRIQNNINKLEQLKMEIITRAGELKRMWG